MDEPIKVIEPYRERLLQSAETVEFELVRIEVKEATPDNEDIKLFNWSCRVLADDSPPGRFRDQSQSGGE
jgi:hypothetical protein